jgi:hypothetical protein
MIARYRSLFQEMKRQTVFHHGNFFLISTCVTAVSVLFYGVINKPAASQGSFWNRGKQKRSVQFAVR